MKSIKYSHVEIGSSESERKTEYVINPSGIVVITTFVDNILQRTKEIKVPAEEVKDLFDSFITTSKGISHFMDSYGITEIFLDDGSIKKLKTTPIALFDFVNNLDDDSYFCGTDH